MAVAMATGSTLSVALSGSEPALVRCVEAIGTACAEIAGILKTGRTGKIAMTNRFGDEQLEIDVLSDRIIFDCLRNSGVVATASSEENPVEIHMGGDKFSVAFDPLDGSSVIGSNFTVGTIFGVWPGSKLLGRTGREQVAAGCAVYGPRTTLSIAIEGKPTLELTLDVDGKTWLVTGKFTAIGEGKLFAPGNLRATQTHPGYSELVNYWITNGYTLRYTGGMVPDVNQLLIKGKGVFCNPATAKAPAKLRLLYECAPLAYLVERSGGMSSDGQMSLLDVPVSQLEVRVQACYGSKDEVERFDKMVGPFKAI